LEHLNFFLNCASNFEKYQSIPFLSGEGGKDGKNNIIFFVYLSVCSKNVVAWEKALWTGLCADS
jgi:hypothetical protein